MKKQHAVYLFITLLFVGLLSAWSGQSTGQPGHVKGTCPSGGLLLSSGSDQVSIACECDSAVSWGGSGVTTAEYSSATYRGDVNFVYCAAANVACRCTTINRK